MNNSHMSHDVLTWCAQIYPILVSLTVFFITEDHVKEIMEDFGKLIR